MAVKDRASARMPPGSSADRAAGSHPDAGPRLSGDRTGPPVAREGIDPAEEGPAYDPLNTVINPDFIRDHDLRAIPPCHARMLPIGLRCLGPVGHQPGLRHNRQTYGIWNRLSSSQRKMWVALYALTSSGSARTTTNSPL